MSAFNDISKTSLHFVWVGHLSELILKLVHSFWSSNINSTFGITDYGIGNTQAEEEFTNSKAGSTFFKKINLLINIPSAVND